MLFRSVDEFRNIPPENDLAFEEYVSRYPAQIVVLACQAVWTEQVDAALQKAGSSLQELYDGLVARLKSLAASVLKELEPIYRKKCEHLITEFVHQRDVIERLVRGGADSPGHYLWLLQSVSTRSRKDYAQRLLQLIDTEAGC